MPIAAFSVALLPDDCAPVETSVSPRFMFHADVRPNTYVYPTSEVVKVRDKKELLALFADRATALWEKLDQG